MSLSDGNAHCFVANNDNPCSLNGDESGDEENDEIYITCLPEIFRFDEFQTIQNFEVTNLVALKCLPDPLYEITQIEYFRVINSALENVDNILILK